MIEKLMGVPPGSQPDFNPCPDIPHTSYLFAGPYDPTMAVPTDSVHLYDYSHTWTEKGYKPRFMIHSRFGEQIRRDPDEFQTDRDGNPWGTAHVYRGDDFLDLIVGALRPEIPAEMMIKHGNDVKVRMDDHYKTPTAERTEIIKDFARAALEKGAFGVGFDEPEYWARTGYEPAFQREWEAYYGTPWEPPHSSVDARYKADRLKSILFERHISAVLTDAKERFPSTVCLLSSHSPIGYYGMGIVTAHHALISIPVVQEVLAEVWNVPFEIGYLEYSSMWHLVRGTGKRLWFFMDPMGDHPGLSLEFYRSSFGENLLAALMFPQIDSYEVLAWPRRIYGQVPREYEILINTVVGALSEMWRYPDGKVEAGSEGIGTFVADSMAWQRCDPSPSDFDGFFGLCKPLIGRSVPVDGTMAWSGVRTADISKPLIGSGIPVQVLSLDRVAEPGYLDDMKVLLLSYDFLKPVDSAQNMALAEWCKHGGSLIVFGGTDPYNAVTESWWQRDGYATPLENLFQEMDIPIKGMSTLASEDTCLSPQDKSLGDKLIVPNKYAITVCTPPSGSEILIHTEDNGDPVAWRCNIGTGRVFMVGIAPGFFATSEQGWLLGRALTRQAMEMTGCEYHEEPYFVLRRGPYTAVRALGEPFACNGHFVDLLSPTLDLLENPSIQSGECAFWTDAGPRSEKPYMMAVSGRLRARYEDENVTSFLTQAPSSTDGVARIWNAGYDIKEIHGFTVSGSKVEVKILVESKTICVTYPNDAEGIIIRINWDTD